MSRQREIKFRAWDERTKAMSEVEMLRFPRPFGSSITIMQYTGLKDKNGKEIYEGDFVEWTTFDGETGEENDQIGFIEWDNGMAGFVITNRQMLEIEADKTEVVGNIYENPELVK